jgi:hypothetical protein
MQCIRRPPGQFGGRVPSRADDARRPLEKAALPAAVLMSEGLYYRVHPEIRQHLSRAASLHRPAVPRRCSGTLFCPRVRTSQAAQGGRSGATLFFAWVPVGEPLA